MNLSLAENALYKYLLHHPYVVSNITDPTFADELYSALTNSKITLNVDKMPDVSESDKHDILLKVLNGDTSAATVSMSFRVAAKFVSSIYTYHGGWPADIYMWYCSGEEGRLSSRIELLLDEVGAKWTPANSL